MSQKKLYLYFKKKIKKIAIILEKKGSKKIKNKNIKNLENKKEESNSTDDIYPLW